MTSMIALVGGQPLPNFLPVQYYHPTELVLVFTKQTQQMYNNLKATLQKKVTVYGLEVDAYDIFGIASALDTELDRIAASLSEPMMFNLTGATKIMSLAAYQIALQRKAQTIYLQSEGKNSRVYHYSWVGEQLQPVENIILPECMTLEDVFNLHFGPGNWQEHTSDRRTKDQQGQLFEKAIAATLSKHGYEMKAGVRGINGMIDVDIAVRLGNQYGIIEAKTGGKATKIEGLQQLHTAAKHLGTYSQTFFVIPVEANENQQALAKAANIEIISLLSYDGTANPLPPEQATTLLDSVGQKLKG